MELSYIITIFLLDFGYCYNVDYTTPHHLKSETEVPMNFGYSMKMFPRDGKSGMARIIIANQHFVNILNVTSPNNVAANEEGIFDCYVGPSSINNFTCSMINMTSEPLAGVSFGVDNNGSFVGCLPNKIQLCPYKSTVMPTMPGYCYKKKNGAVWNEMPTNSGCSSSVVDVIFVLDGSGSIGPRNFQLVKNWVNTVTKGLNIERKIINVGVIQFSIWNSSRAIDDQPHIRTEIKLGSTHSFDDFEQRMGRVRLLRGRTFTGHALEKTQLDFKRDGRASSKKVVILLTDGRSRDPDTLFDNAQLLREMGVITYAVGVGNISQDELSIIATGNTSSTTRVFTVADFQLLGAISNIIQASIKEYVLEGSSDNASTTDAGLNNAQQGFSMETGRELSNAILVLPHESHCDSRYIILEVEIPTKITPKKLGNVSNYLT